MGEQHGRVTWESQDTGEERTGGGPMVNNWLLCVVNALYRYCMMRVLGWWAINALMYYTTVSRTPSETVDSFLKVSGWI